MLEYRRDQDKGRYRVRRLYAPAPILTVVGTDGRGGFSARPGETRIALISDMTLVGTAADNAVRRSS